MLKMGEEIEEMKVKEKLPPDMSHPAGTQRK